MPGHYETVSLVEIDRLIVHIRALPVEAEYCSVEGALHEGHSDAGAGGALQADGGGVDGAETAPDGE